MVRPLTELRDSLKRNQSVRATIAGWRRLTGGVAVRDVDRPTIVACSGGADSSALVFALWAACPEALTVVHVVHDLRPVEETHADRDLVRELCRYLSLPLVEASISVRELAGNAEANARRERYAAIARIGVERGIFTVATAHQADDQLETMLMRLMRGAGPRGLAGIRVKNRVPGTAVWVVRPMLAVAREGSERICAVAKWEWAVDRTNTDTDRTRAAIRAEVAPGLKALNPRWNERITDASALLRGAAESVEREARAALGAAEHHPGSYSFERELLRGLSVSVVGEVLRGAAVGLQRGKGQDALSAGKVLEVARAIRGKGTDPLSFDWGAIAVRVTSRTVLVAAV